jgi:hypothetical protein
MQTNYQERYLGLQIRQLTGNLVQLATKMKELDGRLLKIENNNKPIDLSEPDTSDSTELESNDSNEQVQLQSVNDSDNSEENISVNIVNRH